MRRKRGAQVGGISTSANSYVHQKGRERGDGLAMHAGPFPLDFRMHPLLMKPILSTSFCTVFPPH